MLRAICLILFVSSFAFAQPAEQNQSSDSKSSSAVQVVYVIDGSTMTTYNVDPETLQPASVGTTALRQSVAPRLITSPNGHFLYYSASLDYSTTDTNELYVYDTQASGVPSGLVQLMSAKSLFGMAMHPSGRFLYTVMLGASSGLTEPYTIVRSLIDEKNGRISHHVAEATYQLDVGTSYCSLSILGFNNTGNRMYDAVFCSYPHGTSAATYYERSVNLENGALGPDQQILTWNFYGSSGGEIVQFVNNLVFDFTIAEFFPDSINVYQAQPNVSTPLVNCTSSMWATCGNLGWHSLAHPSGKYVFVFDNTNTTEIGRIDFNTKQIVQDSSIPYPVWQFSPDGSIVYAENDMYPAMDLEIYGFSVASGQVTRGGTIYLPSDLDYWFSAERF